MVSKDVAIKASRGEGGAWSIFRPSSPGVCCHGGTFEQAVRGFVLMDPDTFNPPGYRVNLVIEVSAESVAMEPAFDRILRERRELAG